MEQLAQILGWIATILFTVAYIPQFLKTYKTRNVDGLSIQLLLLPFIGNIIALIYASLIKQPPLQVKYILALLFLSPCIYIYYKVKHNG